MDPRFRLGLHAASCDWGVTGSSMVSPPARAEPRMAQDARCAPAEGMDTALSRNRQRHPWAPGARAGGMAAGGHDRMSAGEPPRPQAHRGKDRARGKVRLGINGHLGWKLGYGSLRRRARNGIDIAIGKQHEGGIAAERANRGGNATTLSASRAERNRRSSFGTITTAKSWTTSVGCCA